MQTDKKRQVDTKRDKHTHKETSTPKKRQAETKRETNRQKDKKITQKERSAKRKEITKIVSKNTLKFCTYNFSKSK